MPEVYKNLRDPGDVPYFLWRNMYARDILHKSYYSSSILRAEQHLKINELPLKWLMESNISCNISREFTENNVH